MADNTIERLQVEVQATSTSAKQSLEALKSTMEGLKKACHGGCGLGTVSKELSNVGEAANRINNSSAAKLSSLAGALSKLQGLNKLSLSSTLASRITELGLAVNSLGAGLGGQTESKLQGLATALSSLTGVRDLKISPTIARQVSEIGIAADSLSSGTATKLNALGVGLMGLSGVQGLKIPNNLAGQLMDIAIAVESMGSVNFGTLTNLGTALGGLNGLKIPASINNQLTKLAQTAENIKNTDFSGFNRLSASLSPLIGQLNTMNGTLPNVAQNINAVSQASRNMAQSNTAAGTSTLNLYAGLMMAVRSVQRIGTAIAGFINRANNYIEDVNLFTASLGQYADQAGEYAQRVAEVMGIDPGAWMRNQGVFMTLATGFGVASDRAYIMSKNLTQLGYDLSSFFNIAVQGEGGAMQKLQAGLSGELEPLRRLGFDLSEARLKAEALSLGIDKVFNSMTQAEKAQLRYHAIMTQVTAAQGDMARTLETPANQLRILKAQVEQAARAFGNVFIPVLNAVLPYAIAVANALRQIAVALAALFGFKMPEIDYSGIGAAAGAASDLGSAVGGAGKAAKKTEKEFKGLLADWDELNIIQHENEDNDNGSGGGGGGGGGAGDWAWDLPEYDFLGGLVKTKVDEILTRWKPVIDWIKDNLNSLILLAEGVGAAILEWSLAKKFIPSLKNSSGLLDNIMKAAAALAIEMATIALNIHFTMDFLENGNWGSLLGGTITDIAGSSLVGRIIQSMFTDETIGKNAGIIATGVSFAINGTIDIVMALNNVALHGFNERNIITLVKGGLEDTVGLAMIANGIASLFLGRKTTVGEKAGLAGSALALTANMTLNVALTKGALINGDPTMILESLASDASTALGVGLSLGSAFKDKNGKFNKETAATGASLVLMADAVVDLYLGVGDIAENGITMENVLAVAKSALEAAVSAGIIASYGLYGEFDASFAAKGAGTALLAAAGVGLSLWLVKDASNQENANAAAAEYAGSALLDVLTTAFTGYSVAKATDKNKLGYTVAGLGIALEAGVKSFELYNKLKEEGWTGNTDQMSLAVVSAAEYALAGIGIGLAAGHPLIGGVLGALLGVGLTLAIVKANVEELDEDSIAITWGNGSLTEEQVQEKVSSLFKFDVNAHVDSLTANVDENTTITANLNDSLATIESQITGIRIGVNEAESYSAIHDALLGADESMGEGTLLGRLQAQLEQNKLNVRTFVTAGEGQQNGGSWVELMGLTNEDIMGEMTAAGKQWGEYFKSGFEGETQELANDLLKYIYDVSAAAARGRREAEFKMAFNDLQISDMTQESAMSVIGQYAETENRLREAYIQNAKDSMSSIASQMAAYQTMVDEYALAHPGESAPAAYTERLAELKTLYEDALKDMEAGYAGAQSAFLADVAEARAQLTSEIERLTADSNAQILKNLGKNDTFANYLYNSESYYRGNTPMFNENGRNYAEMTAEQLVQEFNSALNDTIFKQRGGEQLKALYEQLPEGMKMSVFSEEVQAQLYSDFEQAFGSENLKTLLETQGKDTTAQIKAGMESASSEVEAAGQALGNSAVAGLNSIDYAGYGRSAGYAYASGFASAASAINLGGGSVTGTGTLKRNIPKVTGVSYSMAAAGGEFDTGEFFVARESGPELVGTIGRRTAVANNEHIEEGIASGVRDANAEQNELLRQQNAYLRVIAAKTGKVKLSPSAGLARTVKRSEEMRLVSEGV